MNRPGQPPQRPPGIASTPGGMAPFRYTQFGMPQRNVGVMQTNYVPGLPSNHRTSAQQQSIIPQPSPGFMQQRLQSQQSNGNSNSLMPQMPTSATTPSLGTAPSISSPSDVGLDPNDFPALGSSAPTGSGNATSSSNNLTGANSSVATSTPLPSASFGGQHHQPSSGLLGTGAGTTGAGGPYAQFSMPPRNVMQANYAPGLQPNNHRTSAQQQNILPQPSPGFMQQRTQNNYPFGGILQQGQNQQPTTMQQHTTNSQQSQQSLQPQQANGNSHPLMSQMPTSATTSSLAGTAPSVSSASEVGLDPNDFPALGSTAPTGSANNNVGTSVPPPSASFGGQHHQPASGLLGTGAAIKGAGAGSGSGQYTSNGVPLTLEHHHPQTPAQQVLMSAADRWGLLGLLAMIKNAGIDSDGGLSSIGTDLGTMGLDMGFSGNLYSTFITPWADQSAAHSVEPDFHLPACYNVQPPPPGPNKAAAFSDETLFFMFYSNPRDALQEVAAQELWNRNWRYHKELRFWITKESGTSPSQKVQGGEQGTYTFWDPENWVKERKEMTVLYADLEEKSVPAFQSGPGLAPAQPPQTQGQQMPQQQVGRGSFQMGL